jgi:hypothetical protein
MTDPWGRVAPDCPRNPPKTPPETAGTLVVFAGQIVLRRTPGTARIRGRADVAQLVEHLHGKEGVRGSSPRVGLLTRVGLSAVEPMRVLAVEGALVRSR